MSNYIIALCVKHFDIHLTTEHSTEEMYWKHSSEYFKYLISLACFVGHTICCVI